MKKIPVFKGIIQWFCLTCLKGYTPNITIVWPSQWHTDLCDSCFINTAVTQVAIKIGEKKHGKRK